MMPLRIPLEYKSKLLSRRNLTKHLGDTAFYLYNQGWTVERLTTLFLRDDEEIIQSAIQDRI